ncbi:MAG: MFS transporter [Bacteroidetes bacterium]|nr:MAG: MFS transporter [Bacteroidota bacterium]RLD47562.1 MAG: MFS transporter [Bacteroidota bacterium]RLD73410.1 MAG: MFS transporter [Bacteroidota bacterium]RLD89074.1 MAG: MFS transporter [Bacteroidota bacterium]
MKLTRNISQRNYYSLLWHAGFLAFARNFIDVDTVIPAMLVDAGGTALHVGVLTAIMLGGSSFTQLIFAPFISNYSYKKGFLLLGINSRILALLALGLLLYYSSRLHGSYMVILIFLLVTVFSLGGAFANISYTDIMGKSLLPEARKPFFSIKQVLTGIILLGSVFLARFVLSSAGYPVNYTYMFFIGFGALAIASLGFWNLKEVVPSKMRVKNPTHFFQLVKHELKQNKRLVYFLGFINTQGIAISFLPFVILYAKQNFDLQSDQTGNFLLFKVIGSVVTGLLLFALKGRFRYRNLLYLNIFLSVLLAMLILILPDYPPFFLMFFIGGIIFATYSITMNGVLLEVSDTTNRALYTGITGAGNILPALFPLLGGWIITQYGFKPFFVLFILVILASAYFVINLRCKH